MKLNLKIIRKLLYFIIFFALIILSSVIYCVLSNPYLNYYKKSDLDTNIYQITTQYEVPEHELNLANEDIESQVSNFTGHSFLNWGIYPITNTKDGSNYINMISIYEINVLERLIYNINLYDNTVLTKGINSTEAGIYGWHVVDDMGLVNGAIDNMVPQEYLSTFIPYIKNPKVKVSAKQLLHITNNITKTTAKFNGWFGGNQIELQKNQAVIATLNKDLTQLKANYKAMEHGSICAKNRWSQLTIKCIKQQEVCISP